MRLPFGCRPPKDSIRFQGLCALNHSPGFAAISFSGPEERPGYIKRRERRSRAARPVEPQIRNLDVFRIDDHVRLMPTRSLHCAVLDGSVVQRAFAADLDDGFSFGDRPVMETVGTMINEPAGSTFALALLVVSPTPNKTAPCRTVMYSGCER